MVTDRMENPDRPGPSNEGAALIMGNSVPTWESVYWKRRRQVQVEQATDAMQAYRNSLLREAAARDDDVMMG
jgi:hypothetical protein